MLSHFTTLSSFQHMINTAVFIGCFHALLSVLSHSILMATSRQDSYYLRDTKKWKLGGVMYSEFQGPNLVFPSWNPCCKAEVAKLMGQTVNVGACGPHLFVNYSTLPKPVMESRDCPYSNQALFMAPKFEFYVILTKGYSVDLFSIISTFVGSGLSLPFTTEHCKSSVAGQGGSLKTRTLKNSQTLVGNMDKSFTG